MSQTLSLPNTGVNVLNQGFSFQLAAIAQQIPSLFDRRAKGLVEIQFLQPHDGIGERPVCTICHGCYQCNLIEPYMEGKNVALDPEF